MITAFVFVFGLLVGSFINAVVYRLHTGESPFRGRSHCARCKRTLEAQDLVPIFSFMFLKGRCRYCKKKISWQYPIVEFVTAVLFALTYWRMAQLYTDAATVAAHTVVYAVFIVFLIIIFVYDLKHYLILDVVIVPAAIFAFIANVALGEVWWKMLAAGALIAGFFAVQYFVSGGRWIGGGDIRLGALMGFMLSSPLAFVALFLAYIIGGIVGVGLILAGKKTMGSKVPFGTFLTVSSYIALLYGSTLLTWYLQAITV